MKNKEKEFVLWIKKQINYYKPLLDINLQDIEIEKKEEGYLEISLTYPYLEPILYYTDKALGDYNNKKLKKDRILHELCHILTDPLYAKAISRYVSKEEIEDEREKLTDTICLIIKNLIN